MSPLLPSKRPRRRTNKPRHGVVAAKGVATLLFISALVWLAVSATNGVPGRDYQKLFVSVPDIGSLRGHDKVSIGGVRVGQIAKTTATEQGARIELQLNPGVAIPKDSTVRLRANGLLGARFLQIIPGSSRSRLGDGATIKADAEALTLGVPDALDVFDKETRGDLGTAVRGLGHGMLGNGRPLNTGIRRAARATVPFRKIMEEVLSRPGAAEQLLPSMDSALRPLAASSDDIRRLLRPTDRALRPFVDRREATRETLDEAPPALAATESGLSRGTRLLAATASLATAAHDTLPSAPAGLRQVSALLSEAHAPAKGGSPLQRAKALLDAAGPAVPGLLRITSALDPVLPRLDVALKELIPISQTLGRHGCDIVNFATVVRSMTGFGGTGTGPVGPAMQFRLQAVAAAQALQVEEAGGGFRDAYPEPCKYSPGGEYEVTPLTGPKRRMR